MSSEPPLPRPRRFIDVRRSRWPAAVAALTALSGQARAQDAGAAVHLPNDLVLMSLNGVGTQNYRCRTNQAGSLVWTFEAPAANLLLNGEVVGRHYAGPTWECHDGSRIVGQVIAKAAGRVAGRDIPWLRLAVTGHSGTGSFDHVDAVLRLDTEGGVLEGGCSQAGAEKAVPYRANYVFVQRPAS